MSKSCCAHEIALSPKQNQIIKKVLKIVFAINLSMFFLEIGAGIMAHSSTLTADSLDMLADAFVYGLSLYVINQSHLVKARASLVKGILMSIIGTYVVGVSIYKVMNPVLPVGETISIIGLVALAANALTFLLLWQHRQSDLNLKSAWICSRNDATSNVVVILAGFLVTFFHSMWPDIIVGLGMSLLVLHSSIQIIQESLSQSHFQFIKNHHRS